jgi:DNA-binding transcriptional ArsR family regulator
MTLDTTLTALADPTRRELLRRVAENPCRASALAQGFAISRPAICKHTRLLVKAGLIRARSRGRERIYEIAPRGGGDIKKLIAEFKLIERFWDIALDAFKRYVEENK